MRITYPKTAAVFLLFHASCGSAQDNFAAHSINSFDATSRQAMKEATAEPPEGLQNGAEYTFKPASSALSGSPLCIDVRDGSTANGAAVQLWTCDGRQSQLFVRKGQALQAMGNKCLSAVSGETGVGGKVHMWECEEGALLQSWQSEGRLLRLKDTETCLDVTNSLLNPGSGFVLSRCDHERTSQLFVGDVQKGKSARTLDDRSTNLDPNSDRNILFYDGFDKESLDANHWLRDTTASDDMYHRHEKQRYSDSSKNSFVENRQLHIKVLAEGGKDHSYTSAKIISKRLQQFTYGRLEARIKVPCGEGLRAMVSLLAEDEAYGEWPQSGELNVMEVLGREPETVYATAQFGDKRPNNKSKGGSYSMSSGAFCKDFHVFAIERSRSSVAWFVDGHRYFVLDRDAEGVDFSPAEPWPFDKPFYIALNVAVGGDWAKDANGDWQSAQMVVDSVRIDALDDDGDVQD